MTRIGAPAIHASMLTPLLLMAAGFMCLFATLLFIRVRAALLERRARALRHARAHAPPAAGMDTGTTLS